MVKKQNEKLYCSKHLYLMQLKENQSIKQKKYCYSILSSSKKYSHLVNKYNTFCSYHIFLDNFPCCY